jgi:hypothetical protein
VTSGQPCSHRRRERQRTYRTHRWQMGSKEIEVRLATIAEFGSPQTSPSGCSGSAQISEIRPLSTIGHPPWTHLLTWVRFAHPPLRLKRQQLRSKDGDGNAHVEIPTSKALFQEAENNRQDMEAARKSHTTQVPILHFSLSRGSMALLRFGSNRSGKVYTCLMFPHVYHCWARTNRSISSYSLRTRYHQGYLLKRGVFHGILR